MAGFRPGVLKIAERHALLLVFGQSLARHKILSRYRHCNHAFAAFAASLPEGDVSTPLSGF
jgi:hypothetical protein